MNHEKLKQALLDSIVLVGDAAPKEFQEEIAEKVILFMNLLEAIKGLGEDSSRVAVQIVSGLLEALKAPGAAEVTVKAVEFKGRSKEEIRKLCENGEGL